MYKRVQTFGFSYSIEYIFHLQQSSLLYHLDDILVGHYMGDSDALRRVFCGGAPHQGVLELCRQRAMDGVAHVLHTDTLWNGRKVRD